jgi:O-antigen ligase
MSLELAGAAGGDWWRPASREAPAAAAGSPLPYRALLAFLFILLLSPQSYFPALAPLRIALLAAALAILAHAADRFGRGLPLTVFTREMKLALALLAWAVVTLPLSYWPGGSATFLLEMYLKTVVAFWLIANVVTTREKLRRTIAVMAFASIPLAATAVQNFLTGNFVPDATAVKRIKGYEASLTQNPNDLALMLNLLLPLNVALLLTTRRSGLRLVLLAGVLLNAAGIVVTFSRAGFLTLAVLFMLYLVRLCRRGRPGAALAGLLVAVAASAFLPADYAARLTTIADADSDPTGSAQARRDDTLAAVRFVAHNPVLGAGIGQNVLALNEERGAAWKEVHNAYLEYAVELGLPGLILFLLLLRGCFASVRFVKRQAAAGAVDGSLFHLAEGIEGSLIAFSVAALFHPVAYQFYFYLVAGLAVAARSVCDRQEAHGGRHRA